MREAGSWIYWILRSTNTNKILCVILIIIVENGADICPCQQRAALPPESFRSVAHWPKLRGSEQALTFKEPWGGQSSLRPRPENAQPWGPPQGLCTSYCLYLQYSSFLIFSWLARILSVAPGFPNLNNKLHLYHVACNSVSLCIMLLVTPIVLVKPLYIDSAQICIFSVVLSHWTPISSLQMPPWHLHWVCVHTQTPDV